jgi:hypothetical protein
MQWKEKPLTDFIGRGNEIEMRVGYAEYGLETVFKGYVKDIENNMPLVISCENEMWRLKKITVPAETIEKFDLKAYLQKYGEGVRVEIVDSLSFGSINITEEMSLAQALDKIKDTYPYALGYFQDGIFKAVLNTERWTTSPKPVIFDPDRNMTSDSLKYTLADDVKICMKAISIQRDNIQLVGYAPEKAFIGSGNKKTPKSGWEQRQEFCPQCTTQAEVREYADRRAAEWITDKMEGTITAFGVPFVRKGGVVELRDADRKERDRKRFVADAVDYSFGTSGYRQTISLGSRIA